jgi:malonate transporter and related proteins
VTAAVVFRLLAIFLTVAIGWAAGRLRLLDTGKPDGDPARLLGNVAFYIFVPALLFRTMVRLDYAQMPWHTAATFFLPAAVFLLAVYAWHRMRRPARGPDAAAPSVRAVAASFGNTVQVGIPMATAVWGEAGLAIHIALVSLHAVLLLSLLTVLAELDVARDRAAAGEAPRIWPMLRLTLRNTIVHPVVLPVLAGLAWNLGGWGLHPVFDEALAGLGSAVVPVCLVLIGLTLGYQDLQGQWRPALQTVALKLLALPAFVLLVAHGMFGLGGLPLSVVVMMAALPTGSNALIFAQRYGTLQAETTAVIVLGTLGFVASASLWLTVLPHIG